MLIAFVYIDTPVIRDNVNNMVAIVKMNVSRDIELLCHNRLVSIWLLLY